MTIVFFSNVLNHHQVALCDELYRQNGRNFYFVETGQLVASRKSMGFKQFERDYLIRLSEGDESKATAMHMALNADVAIMGADSYAYLKMRINSGKGVTFSYSERWLKKGLKNILSPVLLNLLKLYLFTGRKCKWYMLAAGGYLANDLRQFGIFKNKVFKWGYFPKYQVGLFPNRTATNIVKLIWVARFLDWKRPKLMIDLGEKLLNEGYDFEISMIGDGPLLENIKTRLSANKELSLRVRLLGNIANEDVLKEMSMSDIYCFTSTRQEGWGTVLGEAMSCGCCPVASVDAGATPFLIEHKQNGLVFETDDGRDLYDKVKYLIDNPSEREKMGRAARETMLTEWSAESAAREFLKLAKIKIEDATVVLPDSNLPASLARIVNKNKQIYNRK